MWYGGKRAGKQSSGQNIGLCGRNCEPSVSWGDLVECGERPVVGLERGFIGGTDRLRGTFYVTCGGGGGGSEGSKGHLLKSEGKRAGFEWMNKAMGWGVQKFDSKSTWYTAEYLFDLESVTLYIFF